MVISYSCSASRKLSWILVLLLILVTMTRVHGQPTTEFMADAANEQQKNLRSFPDGSRNCYTLPSTIGKKFLLRATFTYGNYDGLNKTQDGSLFLFGLHIGVNSWESVNLTKWNPSDTVWKEVLTIALDNFVSVCLINFGSGTPFVSALELRPLEDTMYPFLSPSVSVSYFKRIRFGRVNEIITSYPVDPYDRFWENWPLNSGPWLPLSTSEPVKRLPGNNDFQVPSAILQQASTIRSNFTWLNITVAAGGNLDANGLELLPIFHFAEIANSSSRRTFDIYSNSELLFSNFSPSLLRVESTHQNSQFLRNENATFTLRSVPNSTLPPLINAFELYSLVRMDNFTTASDDGKISDILTHPAGRRPSVVGRREQFLESSPRPPAAALPPSPVPAVAPPPHPLLASAARRGATRVVQEIVGSPQRRRRKQRLPRSMVAVGGRP